MKAKCKFGITGHQKFPAHVVGIIRQAIRLRLSLEVEVVGFSSLAAGADQIFAEEVIFAGGSLMAILPSDDYERSFTEREALLNYRALLAQATSTIKIGFAEPSEQAYWAAGKEVARRSDILLAVWDGEVSAGLGGTADVVKFGQSLGKGVEVIWPEGAKRA